jgi:GNAT superfamily N-acetyltransferase
MRITRSNDAGAAVAILRAVAEEYVARGAPLWNPQSFDECDYAAAARRDELVLGYDGSQPVATMLFQAQDRLFWPDDVDGEARYLHKVAVIAAARGCGWSERLITWARTEAQRAHVRFLRLDTAPRAKLMRLYERLGFEAVDTEPRQFGSVYAVRLQLAL